MVRDKVGQTVNMTQLKLIRLMGKVFLGNPS